MGSTSYVRKPDPHRHHQHQTLMPNNYQDSKYGNLFNEEGRRLKRRVNCLVGFTVVSILVGAAALTLAILLLLQVVEVVPHERAEVQALQQRVKHLEALLGVTTIMEGSDEEDEESSRPGYVEGKEGPPDSAPGVPVVGGAPVQPPDDDPYPYQPPPDHHDNQAHHNDHVPQHTQGHDFYESRGPQGQARNPGGGGGSLPGGGGGDVYENKDPAAGSARGSGGDTFRAIGDTFRDSLADNGFPLDQFVDQVDDEGGDDYDGLEGSGDDDDDCPMNPPRPVCPVSYRVCTTVGRCPVYVCCK